MNGRVDTFAHYDFSQVQDSTWYGAEGKRYSPDKQVWRYY